MENGIRGLEDRFLNTDNGLFFYFEFDSLLMKAIVSENFVEKKKNDRKMLQILFYRLN